MYSGIGTIYTGDTNSAISNITDGNDSTYGWFNQNAEANSYIGLDLGDVYKLDTIRILQGTSASSGDIFSTGILEYSLDNANWTEINQYSNEHTIEADVLSQSLKARYVRLRTPSATNKWYSIREFTVTIQPVDEYAYTNVEAYQAQTVNINRNSASIPAIANALTLKSGEYIGLEFEAIREVTSLNADYTNADKLTLEYSYNGFDWYPATESAETIDVKYIRIINKSAEDVSFNLNGISLENSDTDKTIVAEPAGKEGGEASKAVDNSIFTAFTAAEGSGSLTWRLDAKNVDSLYILQDASAVSDTKVLVRTNSGKWVEAGTLSKGLNVFENLLFYGPVNEVKIVWEENSPTIYEMYTKTTERIGNEQPPVL